MKNKRINLKYFIVVFQSCLLLAYTGSAVYSQQIKPTAAEERLKSLAQKKGMSKASTISAPFRNIGPSVMSGRVVDVDVNPDKPIEFYVAYATGGLWYTKNNGQSFKPVFDSADVIGLGDVTVDWKSGTIWLGTGEANASRSTYSGVGVYKSNDTGRTWKYTGLPESHHIGKIILHPTNPDVVWVAATGHLYSANKERGVYKTKDGGKSWTQVLYVNENTGAIELEINPGNPDELYACMWQKTRSAWNFEEAGAGSGIYKSMDGGNNWQLISGEGSGLPGNAALGRCGIAVFHANPQVLYLLVDNQSKLTFPERKDSATGKKYSLRDFKNISSEQFAALDDNKLDTFLNENKMLGRYNAKQVKDWVASGKIASTELYNYLTSGNSKDATPVGAELYKSEDAGKTWKKIADRTITNMYGQIGYYFGRLTVSATNEKKILLLGIQPMLSIDGGKSFKGISKSNTHADYHAVWMDTKDDQHMVVGNDGGVNITYDDGMNWFKANSPAVGQIYSISVDNANPYNMYVGLQDNGVWYAPANFKGINTDFADPKAFRNLGGGDGMMVLADPRDNKTIYYGSQFGNYARTHLDTAGVLPLKPMHELGDSAFRFNWLAPIMLSKHLPDALYMGGNRLHRSLNKGAGMQTISPDLTKGPKDGDVPYGTITALDESPLRFGLLYAGTDDGNVQLSKDGGYTWKRIDTKLPQGLWVTRVTASAFKEARVYVTLTGYRNDHFNPYVFVSENFGETWKAIHANLPMEPVNVLREDPLNENILYLGTDGGCYVSKTKGASWEIWNKGMPLSVPVYDIAIHKGQNEILLGTHGRSIYKASLNTVNGGIAEKLVEKERKVADEAAAEED
jgi:photosystem II stability/assembly factor-like uncharacterized protein